jgi:hypothetical protein
MLHQVGVSFDLYYDARKHKIKMKKILGELKMSGIPIKTMYEYLPNTT